jgi:hypothetical protein
MRLGRRVRSGRGRLSLGVDVRLVLDLLGGVLKWLALAFAAPLAVALADGEPALPFLICGLAVAVVGWGLDRLTPDRSGLAAASRVRA